MRALSATAICALLLGGCVQPPPAPPVQARLPAAAHLPASDDPGIRYISRIVHLNDVTLQHMAAENPDLYARVRRILASADFLCAPGPASVQQAQALGIGHSQCDALLKTSLPPRRLFTFDLGTTHYIALVVLTQDKPRIMPAQ